MKYTITVLIENGKIAFKTEPNNGMLFDKVLAKPLEGSVYDAFIDYIDLAEEHKWFENDL